MSSLCCSNVVKMFATAEGLLTQQDRVNKGSVRHKPLWTLYAGTSSILFYPLLPELDSILCQAGQTSRVVWTSSSNARRSAFSQDDVQHRLGTEPYASSKCASDLVSLALNRHNNSQGLSVICPGLVMTNLTYGILPTFFWTLIMPITYLIRIFTNTFTLTPYNGAGALMDMDDDMSEALYVKLLENEKAARKRLKEEDDNKQAYKKYLNQTE
ncbi:unnamed protein product [Coregonus sp. 'balchen']|nr:unnamed protein product [Coregonus sp. 'balchen']